MMETRLIASNAGTFPANGIYRECGQYNGQTAYTNEAYWLYWSSAMAMWAIAAVLGDDAHRIYQLYNYPYAPPMNWGWETSGLGTSPGPSFMKLPTTVGVVNTGLHEWDGVYRDTGEMYNGYPVYRLDETHLLYADTSEIPACIYWRLASQAGDPGHYCQGSFANNVLPFSYGGAQAYMTLDGDHPVPVPQLEVFNADTPARPRIHRELQARCHPVVCEQTSSFAVRLPCPSGTRVLLLHQIDGATFGGTLALPEAGGTRHVTSYACVTTTTAERQVVQCDVVDGVHSLYLRALS